MIDDTARSRRLSATRSPHVAEGERIYAIGDVHGRLDLLEQLVGLIRQDNASRPPALVRIICVGDIIDRGPESAEIVRRCMQFCKRTDRFVVLKGNHEAMLVDALHGDFLALSLWLRSGGNVALTSWGVADDLVAKGPSRELVTAARAQIPAGTLAWLAELPLLWRSGDYLFVHAGIRAGVAIDMQKAEDLMWIRDEFLRSEADHGGLVVVHGHSISDEGPISKPNRIGIDTGAYRTNNLTAVMLEADERWTFSTLKPAATSLS